MVYKIELSFQNIIMRISLKWYRCSGRLVPVPYDHYERYHASLRAVPTHRYDGTIGAIFSFRRKLY